MRIAVVGPMGLPFRTGGITRHCAEVYPRLVRLGHEVTLYGRSRYSGRAGTYDGVRLVRVPSPPGTAETPGYALMATVLAARPSVDVVHVHGIAASGFSWLARAAGRRTIFTLHSADHEHAKWGPVARSFLRWSERSTARGADAVIAVSETLADGLRRRVPGLDVRVIPNGVTPPEPGDPATLRRMGLEPGRYVLFVGRLVPEKRVDVLLDAFGRSRAGLTLAVVGDSRDASYEASLRTRAGRHVVFLGRRSGAELGSLYRYAAAFVAPSDHEGFNLTALEALSCGRCVIATDIAAHREVLGADAVYVAPGDPVALSRAIDRCIDEPAWAEALGARGAERLGTGAHSWDRVASEVDAVLRSI